MCCFSLARERERFFNFFFSYLPFSNVISLSVYKSENGRIIVRKKGRKKPSLN